MPAGMVRPRASQAPQLGAGAAAEYIERGWRVTECGRLDAGQRVGPCARCRSPTVRYGPKGQPHCPTCRRCPLPESNEIHTMPGVSDDAREIDRRKIGDSPG